MSSNLSSGGARRTSMYDQKPPEASKPHIPYRDSKLTHILKDSLGNNSFTHLIITLSPSFLCLNETISTLLFTKNAKAVKQNIVENVQFKEEIKQRINKAALENQQRMHFQRSLSGCNQGNALLSQMGSFHNDEDEQMLSDILSELGGGAFDKNHMSNLNLRVLFQLTLAQLKKFKEDHQDMSKQIEEMKRAMDQDLSNKETFQMIQSINQDTPPFNKERKSMNLIEAQSQNSMNFPPAFQHSLSCQDQSTYRGQDRFTMFIRGHRMNSGGHNSLKSISEEEQAQYMESMASPNGQQTVSRRSVEMLRKSQNTNSKIGNINRSSASVGTLTPFEQVQKITSNGSKYDSNPKKEEIEKKESWFSSMIHGFFGSEVKKTAQNQLETHLDTEPGEIYEAHGASIPVSNLTKLKRSLEYKTLRAVMAQHIRNHLRKKTMFRHGFHQNLGYNIVQNRQGLNRSRRQKSHDFLANQSQVQNRRWHAVSEYQQKRPQNLQVLPNQSSQSQLHLYEKSQDADSPQKNEVFEPEQNQGNENQIVIGLRQLKTKGYTSTNLDGVQGMLREVASRQEESEFYCSESDEDKKRYESNERDPQKQLRKLKEKSDDLGSGSISINNMQKLTQKLDPSYQNFGGNLFEKSQYSIIQDQSLFSKSLVNSSSAKAFPLSQSTTVGRGKKLTKKPNSSQYNFNKSRPNNQGNVKTHQLRNVHMRMEEAIQKQHTPSRSPQRPTSRSPNRPSQQRVLCFDNSSLVEEIQEIPSADLMKYQHRETANSMITNRNSLGVMISPLDKDDPSISIDPRQEAANDSFQPPQSVSSITKNDDQEVSFTSQEMNMKNELARRHTGPTIERSGPRIPDSTSGMKDVRKNLISSLNEIHGSEPESPNRNQPGSPNKNSRDGLTQQASYNSNTKEELSNQLEKRGNSLQAYHPQQMKVDQQHTKLGLLLNTPQKLLKKQRSETRDQDRNPKSKNTTILQSEYYTNQTQQMQMKQHKFQQKRSLPNSNIASPSPPGFGPGSNLMKPQNKLANSIKISKPLAGSPRGVMKIQPPQQKLDQRFTSPPSNSWKTNPRLRKQ